MGLPMMMLKIRLSDEREMRTDVLKSWVQQESVFFATDALITQMSQIHCLNKSCQQ